MQIHSYHLANFIDWVYKNTFFLGLFDVVYHPGHNSLYMEILKKGNKEKENVFYKEKFKRV